MDSIDEILATPSPTFAENVVEWYPNLRAFACFYIRL